MKITEIVKRLEAEFPPHLAYEWDNPGLLVGSMKADIKKVLLTLDVTEDAVEQAVESGANLILSHHPVLFGGTKKLTDQTPEERTIIAAIKNDICIYAAHTNCDIAESGINSYLADLLGLCSCEKLEENGLGRIGFLKAPMSFSDFSRTVKEKLNTPYVRISGDENRLVQKIAVGSGACSDSIPAALAKHADVMITADMKYHDMLNYTHSGINIIDAGHFPTEIVVLDIFENILRDFGIPVIKSHNTDIFKYI